MSAPYVSQRKLVNNSHSAMLAAVEIYNKPQMTYRDEVTVTLVVNAWELALKAALRKAAQSIFYAKRKGERYRSVTLDDALVRMTNHKLWPTGIDSVAVATNIRALSQYRDRVIHLYNAPGLGAVIYTFLQQNVLNYRDFMVAEFGKDLAASITWQLLPLATTAPADAIPFMRVDKQARMNAEVRDFIAELREGLDSAQAAGSDLARVATVYDINMQSVKKVTGADLVVAVSPGAEATVVIKKTDPNQTHPFSMGKLLERVNQRRLDRPMTSYDMQVICSKEGLRDNPKYAWKHSNGATHVWSADAVNYLVSLTDGYLDELRTAYRAARRVERAAGTK